MRRKYKCPKCGTRLLDSWYAEKDEYFDWTDDYPYCPKCKESYRAADLLEYIYKLQKELKKEKTSEKKKAK